MLVPKMGNGTIKEQKKLNQKVLLNFQKAKTSSKMVLPFSPKKYVVT